MLGAKPVKERVVPISLIRNVENTEQTLNSIKRISSGFDSIDGLESTVDSWRHTGSNLELCFAMFNERPVGFVILRGSEIKAFVVHPATRRRGVGRRIIDILSSNFGQIILSTDIESKILQRMLDNKSNFKH
jgi:ribosomal protein S18 acetylase RimI-like enzyme